MPKVKQRRSAPSGRLGHSRRRVRRKATAAATSLLLVNMIPKSLSHETEQDSEPSIAVNPSKPNQIVGTAFTPDPMGAPTAPIFISGDGGRTWVLRSTVPSAPATGDISPRFGGNGRLYTGILKNPGDLLLNILRTANAGGTTPMSVLSNRNEVDQPFLAAVPINGRDRVYVGNNDFASGGGRTATIDLTLHGAAPAPAFRSVRLERRPTGSAQQDGPQVRPACHSDGTVYAAFYGWRSFSAANQVTSDVVLVRDDQGGSGQNPFSALVDPQDGIPGRLVAKNVRFKWNDKLGNQRVGGDIAIAVDPQNSSTVYVAWADQQPPTGYTLHVRRSTDRGATWSANDLRTIGRATNPALAINNQGKVCFLYQRVTGTGASQRWVTTVDRSNDGVNWSSLILATVPANFPVPQFQPYIGDYAGLASVGKNFYGIFSTNNSPDQARFPNEVIFQRNCNFATRRLLDLDGTTPVAVSIDPFFFKITE
jgi:hypothetical protein